MALRLACMDDGPLREQLQRLRDLPAHGNRKLQYHHLFLGLLLAFFDPLTRSLRLIEDQGDFGGKLDLPRLARSTTADALRVFDELAKPNNGHIELMIGTKCRASLGITKRALVNSLDQISCLLEFNR